MFAVNFTDFIRWPSVRRKRRRMFTAIQCVVMEFMLHRPNSLSWKAFARIELVMMVIMLITSRVFGHSQANDRARAIYSIQFPVQRKCK